ncbi:MAG: phosphatidylglycerophosphatase A [Pseudomonadota bacterium]
MNEFIKLKLATHVCRVTPIGLAPAAPGTAGAIVGLCLAVAAWQGGFAVYFLATTFVVFAGTWAAEVYEKTSRTHDDRRIVIDEVAGMMLSLAGWENATVAIVIAAFVLFRFFDIVKPYPISWIDKRVGGGVGVMADDLAAGAFTVIALEILRPFI